MVTTYLCAAKLALLSDALKFARAERGSRENPDLPSFLAVDLVLFEGVVEGAKNFAVHVF